MGWTNGAERSTVNRSLCVNLCVKKFQKLAKMCKISKNVKIVSCIVTVF